MRVSEIFEGWFDSKKEPKLHTREISVEERELIRKYFPNTNAFLRKGEEFLFPKNATAVFGRGDLRFYTEDDELAVSVGFYRSEDDAGDPKKSPIVTKTYTLRSEQDFKKLRDDLRLDGKNDVQEAIKGWKNAHGDLMKIRAQDSAGKDVKLVRLKKDGQESGMHDATKLFKDEAEARAYHANIAKLNPGKGIKHNLYVNGEVQVLEEGVVSSIKSLITKFKAILTAPEVRDDQLKDFDKQLKDQAAESSRSLSVMYQEMAAALSTAQLKKAKMIGHGHQLFRKAISAELAKREQ